MSKKIVANHIKLKRAYEPPTVDNGTRILIDRLWPRGVRKADAAITGRIMKPFLHAVLRRILEPDYAGRLIHHITALFLELECKALQPTRATPTQNEPPSQEPVTLEANRNERVIKVADIDPQHRHTIIFRLFEHLALDDWLQIVVDHHPKPLRLQLEARHGSRCNWFYLEKGPDIWRVRLRLLGPGSGYNG